MINWLWVFDRDFVQVGAIDTYISCIWEEEYMNRGVFTLIISDTEKNIKLAQENYYLYFTDRKSAMVIKYKKINRKNQTIELHGYTTLELINQRGLFGAKMVKNAEEGMRNILAENLRGLPAIAQTENKGYTEIYGGQFSNTSMLEIFSTICARTELGIRMIFDRENKRHLFDVYKGVDRTFGKSSNGDVMLFLDDWGTLTDTIITEDSSVFKNVAYVLGAGEGENRVLEIVELPGAVGRDRYELFVDARDLQQEDGQTIQQYRDILRARGLSKLNEHNKKVNFSAEVDSENFGKRYNLGDKVTCRSNRYNIQLDVRIMRYKQVIENNISKIYLTLGEPEITMIGELKLWLR